MNKYISKIFVESLFGLYSYNINLNESEDLDLIMIYGDNGCGKTTILELIYHILHHADGKNHKTFVAKTAFKKFNIYFKNNLSVLVERLGEELIGSFKMSITDNGALIDSFEFIANENLVIKRQQQEKEYHTFLAKLKNIGITFHFISQSRRVLTDKENEEKGIYSRILSDEMISIDEATHFLRRKAQDEIELSEFDFYLKKAVASAHKWIQSKALQGSNMGSSNANNIYLQLVKNIGGDKHAASPSVNDSLTNIKANLEILSSRCVEHAKIGLMPSISKDISELLEALNKTLEENYFIVEKVLEPFIEGITARLDALDPLQKLTNKFIDNVNDFLVDKQLFFELIHGFRIVNKKGKTLELSQLSSGEKQLLLLLCNTLASRDEANIFIIDEPEISLNVKWQRGLVRALLECTEGSDSQFILATHSFELLSNYANNSVKLVSTV